MNSRHNSLGMKHPKHRFVLAALAVVVFGFSAPAAPDPVMNAIRAEITRTMAQLQLPESPKPYFVSCSLTRNRFVNASASFGALISAEEGTMAHLSVTVRVGDYRLDNSNFMPKQMWGGWSRMDWAGSTPIDSDPEVLRRAIWWTIDQAYKMAVENLKRKRAVLENRSTPPVADDWAKAPAFTWVSPVQPQVLPATNRLAAQVRDLSSRLRQWRQLQTGAVQASAYIQECWQVNSEGLQTFDVINEAAVSATATAQADDGVKVGDQAQFVARQYDQLPAFTNLATEVEALGRRVESMRTAPSLDDFAGPVLFEGQAAAELCARILPEAFSSRRQPVAEDEQADRWFFGEKTKDSLRHKIGRRVMTTAFNVTDDPTLEAFDGIPLVGYLLLDLEGVRPEKVNLVKGGILKTLLTTRTPDKKLPVSNGHAVSYAYAMEGPVVKAGITSLIIRYDNGLDEKALRDRLIQAARDQEVECGLLVRRIPPSSLRLGGPQEPRSDRQDEEFVIKEPLYVYCVYPDGREKLVRVVSLKGVDFPAFKDILAAGKKMVVYNFSGRDGAQSIVTPALLFEEGIVAAPERDVTKPPLLPSPLLAPDELHTRER